MTERKLPALTTVQGTNHKKAPQVSVFLYTDTCGAKTSFG